MSEYRHEFRLIRERNALKQRVYDLRMALERLCAALHGSVAASHDPAINHAFAEAVATLQDEPKMQPTPTYTEEG